MGKSQTSSIQDLYDKPVKKPPPFSVLKPPNSLPTSKTSNKKARREIKRYYHQIQTRLDSGPPVTSINVTNTPGGARNGGDRKDISKAICYNCNKKGHFMRNYFKPQKNRGTSKN